MFSECSHIEAVHDFGENSLWMLLEWILLVIVTRVNVLLKLIFYWRALRVRMIVGEPKWAPHLEKGVVPILESMKVGIAFGDFVTLCLIRGWVSWIFLVWELQVVVTGLICF